MAMAAWQQACASNRPSHALAHKGRQLKPPSARASFVASGMLGTRSSTSSVMSHRESKRNRILAPTVTTTLASPLAACAQRQRRGRTHLRLLPQHHRHHHEEGQTDERKTTALPSTASSAEGGDDKNGLQPRLYNQRWIQLAYLSLLALLSDWICFSVAANPSTFEAAYPGHSAANLIDIFLFTNVASCFLVTDVVAKFGLERAIKAAAVVMSAGCLLRSGLPNVLVPVLHHLGLQGVTAGPLLVPFGSVVAGTICVGAAQPFFQCTPPLLSATWFGSDERATSTAVALNFNQIGIATAFLVGGGMATTAVGLSHYFTLISAVCAVVSIGTILQFQDKPPTPPSSSEIEKMLKNEKEPPFIDSVRYLFGTTGFTRALAAFVCSISITNVVGAFIDQVMERGGITDQFNIDLAGAGFELAILLGGIIIGGYVDRTKEYKSVTQACIICTMACIVPLGLTDHAMGKEPLLLVASLLGLGMAAGPVQPINAELAVDVTYPCDETAVESVQQIGGNLISALMVPLAEKAARQDFLLLPKVRLLESDVRGDVVLLVAVAAVTYAYFLGFEAPLRRTIADGGGGDDAVVDVAAVAENGAEAISIMPPTLGEEQTSSLSTVTIDSESKAVSPVMETALEEEETA